MTLRIAHTEINGRLYEIIADSEKANAPMFLYVQVHRLRKDGSRGRKLAMHHATAWQAWKAVKNQIENA